jgi:hypothetical protein
MCPTMWTSGLSFHGYAWLFTVLINNENALIDIVISSDKVDDWDSFYSYEGVRRIPVEC